MGRIAVIVFGGFHQGFRKGWLGIILKDWLLIQNTYVFSGISQDFFIIPTIEVVNSIF